ncbi:MAG: hypothetical protein ACREHD_22705, partial [Pirellulales bacterium]
RSWWVTKRSLQVKRTIDAMPPKRGAPPTEHKKTPWAADDSQFVKQKRPFASEEAQLAVPVVGRSPDRATHGIPGSSKTRRL